MKSIETYYKGYKFRSRLEARWAVFFDACGVKWEYESEGFDLGDGFFYLPDFLLHDVHFKTDEPYIEGEDLYVEVKGQMTEADRRKLLRFGRDFLIVGNIPSGNSISNFFWDIQGYNDDDSIAFFNFVTSIGDNYPALPCVSIHGNFLLGGGDYAEYIDEEKTIIAYNKARQARFEHGESPDKTDFAEPFDLLLSPNDTPIDILRVEGKPQYFVKAARLFTAITGQDASISDRHPIIKAADAIGVTSHRFRTKRLSGNDSYGKKAFYFAVNDVPKLLLQYAEHKPSLKGFGTFQLMKASLALYRWFNSEVVSKYGQRTQSN